MNMKSIRTASLLVIALLGPLGSLSANPATAEPKPAIPAGDTHAKVMEEMIGSVNKMSDIIGKAKDKETAEVAAAELGKLEAPLKKIAARAKALGDPDEALEKKLEEKFKPQLEAAMGKMMKSMMGIAANPEAMAPIQSAMERIGEIMQSIDAK